MHAFDMHSMSSKFHVHVGYVSSVLRNMPSVIAAACMCGQV